MRDYLLKNELLKQTSSIEFSSLQQQQQQLKEFRHNSNQKQQWINNWKKSSSYDTINKSNNEVREELEV